MALPISHSCYLVLCLFSFANLAFSQSTITTTATVSSVTPGTQTASSTYNVFSAIASSSSHNGATGSTDDPDTSAAANAEGAAGSQAGAFNLSNGAIIAISVVAGAAVILGISSAILFYISKKRQWELREKMRRSARKAVAALTPRRDTFARSELPLRTDGTPSSSKREKRGMVRIDPPPAGKPAARNQRDGANASRGGGIESNMEKGLGTRTTVEAVTPVRESSGGTPPKSTFDMDSPVETRGKGWPRIFGRR